MAGSLSAYAERGLLNLFFSVGAGFASPADIYIGLSTADPGHDGSGMVEPIGGSYARVQVNTWNAAATSTGAARSANTSEIAFPTPSGSWGSITHFFGTDAAMGGNVLFSGSCGPATVVTAEPVKFSAGDLDISLSGHMSDAINEGLLDHLLKVASYTAPAAIWIALSTADPTANGGSLAEVTGGTYARKQITGWNLPASESIGGTYQSRIENSFTHEFAAAGGGKATWMAFLSAVTGGTYYGRAQLARPRTANVVLRVPERAIDFVQT